MVAAPAINIEASAARRWNLATTKSTAARAASQVTARGRGAAHARTRSGEPSPGARRCRRKFLRFFAGGFRDETYDDWERGYKWKAHERWQEVLAPAAYRALLRRGAFGEIAAHAIRI